MRSPPPCCLRCSWGAHASWVGTLYDGLVSRAPTFLLPFQLAVQLGLTIARCARVDYPAEWPGLLAELWAFVEGNHLGIQGARTLAHCAESGTHRNPTPYSMYDDTSPAAGRRALLVLHYVIKELASKRLAADQRVFEEVTGSCGV